MIPPFLDNVRIVEYFDSEFSEVFHEKEALVNNLYPHLKVHHPKSQNRTGKALSILSKP